MSNHLYKYLFAGHVVRGQVLSLDSAWQAIVNVHQYPSVIQSLLGELVSAGVLLAANLKFDGTLILQIQGDGPVSLLVVECQSDLSIRATVKLREQHISEHENFQTLVNQNGNGRFAIILDPNNKQPGQHPYQGIVGLHGESVADVLEHYMEASEQLQTKLWLGANRHQAGGVLLQQLPDHGGNEASVIDADQWDRLVQLCNTLKSDELTSTDAATLAHRLFWQEDRTEFEPQTVIFKCRCSHEKVANVIRMLGENEVKEILTEQTSIQIACDYCGTNYQFNADECLQLLSEKNQTHPGSESSH